MASSAMRVAVSAAYRITEAQSLRFARPAGRGEAGRTGSGALSSSVAEACARPAGLQAALGRSQACMPRTLQPGRGAAQLQRSHSRHTLACVGGGGCGVDVGPGGLGVRIHVCQLGLDELRHSTAWGKEGALADKHRS